MKAMLVGRTGKVAGADFEVGEAAAVGAAATNQVRVRVRGVSRNHARIWSEEGVYFVEDAGSTNGTFVNGELVRKLRLRHLDVLSLGGSVDLIFLQREERLETRRRSIHEVTLRWLSGEDEGESFSLAPGLTTVGRATSCTLVANGTTVSKLHAEISRMSDRVMISDLGSTNGTRVNGQPLTEPVELQDNDRISFGKCESTVRIVGEVASAETAAPVDTVYRSMVFDQGWRTRLIWDNEESELPEARPSLDELRPDDEENSGKAPAKHD